MLDSGIDGESYDAALILEAQGFAAEVLRDSWIYLIRAVKN